jgi:uncharacterized protein YcnI
MVSLGQLNDSKTGSKAENLTFTIPNAKDASASEQARLVMPTDIRRKKQFA